MATTGTAFSGEKVDLAPDAEHLPIHVERRGNRTAALVFLIAGVTDVPTGIVLMALGLRGGPLPLLLVGGVILAGSVPMFLLGRHQQMLHDEWEFTSAEVRRRRRGLFGGTDWAEPLSAYEGVLAREERRGGGQYSTPYSVYVLELRHASAKRRNVRLYASRAKEGFRARHEHYARLFGRPALISTAAGIEQRQPEDLAKSLRQRVAEGSVAVTFDPTVAPPGRRLTTSIEGDTLVIRSHLAGKGAPSPLALVLIGAGLASIIAGFLMGRGALPFALRMAGIPLALLGLAIGAFSRMVRQELRVSPAEVRTRWIVPWGTVANKRVRAGRISEVLIQKPPEYGGRPMVCIVADDTVLPYGFGLKQAEKEWVRDCIIAVISRSDPAVPSSGGSGR